MQKILNTSDAPESNRQTIETVNYDYDALTFRFTCAKALN